MNPMRAIFSPIRDLTQAVVMPFKALFVVGLTGTINAMTYSGYWWFKWVALGMGIAVLVAFARAARTLLVLGLVALVGHHLYKRYGHKAREQFDDWVRREHPKAGDVIHALRPSPDRGAPLHH